MMTPRRLLLAAGLLTAAAQAHAGGDPNHGEAMFDRRCAACHSIEKNLNRVGPSLYGVMDQPAATLLSFQHYSDAMRAFAANGVKWDDGTFAAYVRSPRRLVPGTNMTFAGLTDDKDIADIIAFLRATNARQ